MRICFDVQAAVSQRAGVGRYARSLAEALARTRAPDDSLRLFHFDFRRRGEAFAAPGAERRAVRWVPGRWVQGAWKTLGAPPFDWFSGAADVFHFPNFVRPPLSRGRSVITIHDISFLLHPAAAEPRNLRYLGAQIRRTVDRADRILADCRFVADEIVERLGADPDRVSAVYPGLQEGFVPAPPEAVRAVRAGYGLDRPYLLHVGTIEPRKNHVFLAGVFERMTEFDGDLALAGMTGWKAGPILERLRRSGRADRIRQLGYVPDRDLPALYSGAELFLFPSLYEGFGFPPLEAMACGCPALASDAGALKEVLAGGAALLDLGSEEAWAAEATRILAGAGERARRQALGRERARRYSWDETARRAWALYRETAGS